MAQRCAVCCRTTGVPPRRRRPGAARWCAPAAACSTWGSCPWLRCPCGSCDAHRHSTTTAATVSDGQQSTARHEPLRALARARHPPSLPHASPPGAAWLCIDQLAESFTLADSVCAWLILKPRYLLTAGLQPSPFRVSIRSTPSLPTQRAAHAAAVPAPSCPHPSPPRRKPRRGQRTASAAGSSGRGCSRSQPLPNAEGPR